jgi:hypothetical protein
MGHRRGGQGSNAGVALRQACGGSNSQGEGAEGRPCRSSGAPRAAWNWVVRAVCIVWLVEWGAVGATVLSANTASLWRVGLLQQQP